jgi:hypothetical protein
MILKAAKTNSETCMAFHPCPLTFKSRSMPRTGAPGSRMMHIAGILLGARLTPVILGCVGHRVDEKK